MLLQAEKEADHDISDEDLEYIVEMAAQMQDSLKEKEVELDSVGNHDGKLGSFAVMKQVGKTSVSAENNYSSLSTNISVALQQSS